MAVQPQGPLFRLGRNLHQKGLGLAVLKVVSQAPVLEGLRRSTSGPFSWRVME
ncbi:MAG: hypothetical protein ACOZCE_01150 [Spirochaetota bacterium]